MAAAAKKLGLRILMDVIPLDATLVKGSLGRRQMSLESKVIAGVMS